ncbi:MAG: ribonuclease domain-containing protein, partial [Nocardioides sp.]
GLWLARGLLWGSGNDAAEDYPDPAVVTATNGTDQLSGLPVIEEGDLPSEARDTLALIDAGGPFPYSADDSVFGNREELLPDHESGYYREDTVSTPGESDRGARRIVVGRGGEYYYTDDHYQSFERIDR